MSARIPVAGSPAPSRTSEMRSPWQVTLSVWHALFIREVLARTTGDRLGWFWMLGEPVALIALMVTIRTFARDRSLIDGVEYIPWLIVGLIAFFLFREGMTRSLSAIAANQALFAYRQVKPIDPVLVRCLLEGIMKTAVLLILISISTLLGYRTLPVDPLGAMFVWFSIWLLGLGTGLTVSVAVRLVPDIDHFIKMLMMPMFILSGAIFPVQTLPHQIQQYLLYNPVLHGLECLRRDFFAGYRSMQAVDLAYLWQWILVLLALGLALHVRFGARLKAK